MTTEARVVSLQGILRQTWCANVAIGLQSPKWNLQKALIYLLCQGDMFCFPLVLVCPSGCYTIRSHHWFDRGQRRQRKTLCASTWCECSFVYVRVRQGVVRLIFLVNSLTSNLWLFQMGSSISERWNVCNRDIVDELNLWILPCWHVSTSARAIHKALLCFWFLIKEIYCCT